MGKLYVYFESQQGGLEGIKSFVSAQLAEEWINEFVNKIKHDESDYTIRVFARELDVVHSIKIKE